MAALGQDIIAEIYRISRGIYHRFIRHIQRNKRVIPSEKMAHAVMSNNYRDLWSEVRKAKGRNSKISCGALVWWLPGRVHIPMGPEPKNMRGPNLLLDH